VATPLRPEALDRVLQHLLAEEDPFLLPLVMLLPGQGMALWPSPAGGPSAIRTGRALTAGRAGTMSLGLMQAGGGL